DLYVGGSGSHRVRYGDRAAVTPPTVRVRPGRGAQDAGNGGGRGAALWLQAEDDTDPAPRIPVRRDDGPWQDHDPDRMVLVRPGRHLRYRAVDAAWNASPVQTSTIRSGSWRSEEHTSELQSRFDLVCRLLLDKKKIH